MLSNRKYMAPRLRRRRRFQLLLSMMGLSACCALAACLLSSSLDSLGNGNAAGTDASTNAVDASDSLQTETTNDALEDVSVELDARADASDSAQTDSPAEGGYPIRWTSTPPMIGSTCSYEPGGEWAQAVQIPFGGSVSLGYNNTDEDCRLMWSTVGTTARVYGRCKVVDRSLVATAKKGPDGGRTYDDDEIELFIKADPGASLDQNTNKFSLNIGTPTVWTADYFPNGSFPGDAIPDAVVQACVLLLGADGGLLDPGSLNPGTVGQGYIIEWQVDLGFAVQEGGQIGRCDLLINDRDLGSDSKIHVAFTQDGGPNYQPGSWGICQFMPQ
jgi:hypothetical protein